MSDEHTYLTKPKNRGRGKNKHPTLKHTNIRLSAAAWEYFHSFKQPTVEMRRVLEEHYRENRTD